MAIGTNIEIYLGNGWEAGKIRGFIPEGHGIAKVRVFVLSTKEVVSVPTMAIRHI